jgi:hypothetical protein
MEPWLLLPESDGAPTISLFFNCFQCCVCVLVFFFPVLVQFAEVVCGSGGVLPSERSIKVAEIGAVAMQTQSPLYQFSSK